MGLSKRLILVICGLFTLVFIGTLSISISNTRSYLSQQLQINSQDTATSLGKSLSDSIVSKDIAKLTSIIDAIYDRGFYSLIHVQTVNGETLVKREMQQIHIKHVPKWFTDILVLKTPSGRQEIITLSFRRAGQVIVSAHPGIAYKELWNTFTDNLWWLSIVGLISFGTIFLLIRYLMAPILLLEAQANEIAKGNFVIQDILPSTPELNSVASTMNKMSIKVSQMLEAQTELTEQMRTRAYQDSVSGLKNRRYFAEQMDHLIKTPEEFLSGSLMLIEISDFKQYNQKLGYVKADELLVKVGSILKQNSKNIIGACLARVSGASFALLAPNIGFDDTKTLVKKLHGAFELIHNKGIIDDVATLHVGIAFYDGNQDNTELLSMADMALRAAQIKGPNHWHIYDEHNVSQDQIRSASNWRDLIQKVIDEKTLILHYQPVKDINSNEILHFEVLARMPDQNGDLMTASTFLPMAQRNGLAIGIDIVVIEKLFETMGDESQLKYAVNLSSEAIQDGEFIKWLTDLLKTYPHRAESIIFEMREYSATSHLSEIRETIHRLRELGCAFSLDHFGTGSPDFGYLLNTKIDYIKIDGGYVHNIETNEDNQFFLKSIVEIAHGLDIKVIGEYVETEVEWHTLKTLNLDGVQGHYIGRPDADVSNSDSTESPDAQVNQAK